MKISGFTIAKNAVKYDYPIIESITSILPVCDEFIIGVGRSEDSTLDLIKSIKSEKIVVFESVWDDSLRKDGRLLAVETNKALRKCTGDWCFYIQADEVVHEKDLQKIKSSAGKCFNNKIIEGLEFDFIHFYGSYNTFQDNRREWYKHEIRIVRNREDIYSFGDAMGFRKKNSKGEWEKLKTKNTNALIYHYGWVKPPGIMKVKKIETDKMYLPDEIIEKEKQVINEENIYLDKYDLSYFKSTHPSVMNERVNAADWVFNVKINGWMPGFLRRFLVFLDPLTKRIKKTLGIKPKERRYFR